MSMIHHPDESTLMSYAAGSLPEPLSLIIAAHCSVCPLCAAEVRKMEHIGSALFGDLTTVAMVSAAPCMALRSPETEPDTTSETGGEAGSNMLDRAIGASVAGSAAGPHEVPEPLRHLVGDNLDAIAWQRLGFGVWHAPVLKGKSVRGDVRLLKVEPGRAMPEHGHGGSELTMILRGAYHDEVGRFGPGDVADLDDEIEHQPVADARLGCICIIASEKQAVFKGFFARLIQPLTGI
jgi:putative transcriptional regulator